MRKYFINERIFIFKIKIQKIYFIFYHYFNLILFCRKKKANQILEELDGIYQGTTDN